MQDLIYWGYFITNNEGDNAMKYKVVFFSAILFLSINLFAQNRNFGIGIQLGEPSGVDAKIWTSGNNAIDLGAGWSFDDRDVMTLQADYVWHSFNVFPVSQGELPLYFGIGARAILGDDPIVGARVPIGIAYMFETFPLDIFMEIAPILNIIPSTDPDLAGGVGIRFRI